MARRRKFDDDGKPIKKRRISKLAKIQDDVVAWGTEPTWVDLDPSDPEQYQNDIRAALNWYNYLSVPDKLRKWTLEYFTKTKTISPDKIKKLSEVSVGSNSVTFSPIGSLCRGLLLGATLSEPHMDYIIRKANDIIESDKNAKAATPRMATIQAADPKVAEFIASIEDAVEKKGPIKLNVVEFLVEQNATVKQSKSLANFYLKEFLDLDELLESSDPDLVEAYSHLSKPRIKQLHEFYATVVDSPNCIKDIVKSEAPAKARKPRKKKAKSAEKILKKFKYLDYSSDFKIKSINPADILGAKELWVYHSNTRDLGVFKAASEEGFTVSGSSIRNFVEETAVRKRLFKPQEVLPEVMKAGKVALRHIMDGIKRTPQRLRSSINATTLLLRVVE